MAGGTPAMRHIGPDNSPPRKKTEPTQRTTKATTPRRGLHRREETDAHRRRQAAPRPSPYHAADAATVLHTEVNALATRSCYHWRIVFPRRVIAHPPQAAS